MASKPSTPGSAQETALIANLPAKSGAVNGASVASRQFDDAFASALEEGFGVNKSPASLPGPGKQSPPGPTKSMDNRPVPDPKTIASTPNVANVQAGMPVKVVNQPIPEELMAVAVKTPGPILQPTPKKQPSPPISSEGESKTDKTKKPEPALPPGGADTEAASYPIAMPIMPALPSVPNAASNKNDPPQSPENSARAVRTVPPAPALAAGNATVTSAATVPSAKDTEAFSINLTPKAISAPNLGTGSPIAPPPKREGNKPDVTVPPVSPAKPATNAMMPIEGGQADLSRQIIQPKKTGDLAAISSPSAAPSSLGQSSGLDREGKPQGKDAPIVPVSIVSDGGGSKQEVAGFGSTPASVPKETKDAGSASDARPVAQPVNLQDAAPAAGPAKEVAIRLQGQSGETINVKLTDQGGQVQVTVRSSDPVAASALRQDLSSLTGSLDKAGWKPEIAVAAAGNSFEPVNQARQTDRNNQDPQGNKQPEWQQETPKKRQSVSDLWDELLTNQTA